MGFVRRNLLQARRISDEPLINGDRSTDQINVTIYGTAHNVVVQSKPVGYSSRSNVIHCADEPDEDKCFRQILPPPDVSVIAYSTNGIRCDETDDLAFRGSDAACVFQDALGKRFVAMTINCSRIGPFL